MSQQLMVESLIKEKKRRLNDLEKVSKILQEEIKVLEIKKNYNIDLNRWYKIKNDTIFFKPRDAINRKLIGVSIVLDPDEFAAIAYDSSFHLDRFDFELCNNKEEMLSLIHSHNETVFKNIY